VIVTSQPAPDAAMTTVTVLPVSVPSALSSFSTSRSVSPSRAAVLRAAARLPRARGSPRGRRRAHDARLAGGVLVLDAGAADHHGRMLGVGAEDGRRELDPLQARRVAVLRARGTVAGPVPGPRARGRGRTDLGDLVLVGLPDEVLEREGDRRRHAL